MPSIEEMWRRSKQAFSFELVLVLVVVLVALGGFLTGWLARDARDVPNVAMGKITIPACDTQPETMMQNQDSGQAGVLVGSKNSDKYHYEWCSGAKRINQENIIRFASQAEAKAQGYTPAGNCPGLTQ